MNNADRSLCGRMIRSKVYSSTDALTTAVIGLLREQLAQPHAIMLAGGATPMAAYRKLADAPVPVAEGLHLLFSDDRHVPPTDPRSNFGNVEFMIRALRLPAERVLRVHGERPLDEAVALYQQALASFLDHGGRIAVGLLGLGADGHTASLFSRDDIERSAGRWAVAVRRPDGLDGVSVTPEFIARVERIIFLVSGKQKREMARTLLMDSLSIPAGLAVRNNRNVELWTDPDAWPFD